jgi:hypothetical protein
VPAAAVIPAPIAYIKVVAVKTLVVVVLLYKALYCTSVACFCQHFTVFTVA